MALTTGVIVGFALLLIGGAWRINEDDHIKKEQEKEIENLKMKVENLENGFSKIDRVANALDMQLDKIAKKMDEKF